MAAPPPPYAAQGAHPTAGYASAPVYPPGYVPPPQPQMMYSYPPPMPQQQTSNNVTIVNAGAPVAQTVVVENLQDQRQARSGADGDRTRGPRPSRRRLIPSTNGDKKRRKRGVNHCLHCCITLFFWPWIIVWIILCLIE